MGIYDSGKIFGIKIYNFNDDDFANILFEKTHNEIMTDEEKQKAYVFYNGLANKTQIHFQYYTECSSTYGTGTVLTWYPLPLNVFLEKFGT
jgi:NADH:ubiquinone oxidoreductase subunit